MDLDNLKKSAWFAVKVIVAITLFLIGFFLLAVGIAKAIVFSPIGALIGALVLAFAGLTALRYRYLV